MNFLNYFGGNRCAVTIGCGIATTFLCYMGKISGEVYATVIIATVGVYIGNRLVESVKRADSV